MTETFTEAVRAAMFKEARLSDDGVYRYTLTRAHRDPIERHKADTVNFIMLNPSTADADLDDPTTRRCMEFAWSWGYKSLTVTNLFALRSTDPRSLYSHPEPVGDDNDNTLLLEAIEADKVIMAWGTHGVIWPSLRCQ